MNLNSADHPSRTRNARRRMLMTMIAGITSVTLLAACTTTGETADSSTAVAVSNAAAVAAAADTELFDSSVVHSISIDYDEAAYDAMMATFVASGDKEWISATVTIDGTVFENVGIKLKGNSSLQGLRGTNSGAGPDAAGTDSAGTDSTATDSAATDSTASDSTATDSTATDSTTPSADADTDQAPPGGRGGGMQGGPSGDVSADEPEGLPWRITLDKYVDGQNYKGQTDLVVRGNNTETSLNEAVALELLSAAGLSSEEAISSRFSVNGSEQTLRLVVQNPGDEWYEENYDTDGLLYKAESGGDYSYRGEDPASYVDVFDVEASTSGEDDYAPLINFLEFLNESDDATFAAELAEHLDVQAFANYLAMQDLVANTDDIDGPGNNSYLQYDSSTGIFTVVPWDQNLSFGGMGGGDGMDAAGGFGGQGGGFPDGQMPGGGNMGDRPEPSAGMGAPADGAEAAGTDGAAGADAAAGTGGTATAPSGFGGQGGGRGDNILAERFTANADFNALYEQAKTDLTASLYTSGDAQAILDQWVSVLTAQAADLVPAETIETEAAAISKFFTAA